MAMTDVSLLAVLEVPASIYSLGSAIVCGLTCILGAVNAMVRGRRWLLALIIVVIGIAASQLAFSVYRTNQDVTSNSLFWAIVSCSASVLFSVATSFRLNVSNTGQPGNNHIKKYDRPD